MLHSIFRELRLLKLYLLRELGRRNCTAAEGSPLSAFCIGMDDVVSFLREEGSYQEYEATAKMADEIRTAISLLERRMEQETDESTTDRAANSQNQNAKDDTLPLNQLQKALKLGRLERLIVLMGLSVEVDPGFQRVYGYFHDNMMNRLPGIGLAVRLLCDSAEESVHNLRFFRAESTLVSHGILRIVGETQEPFLSKSFMLDERIVRFLLEDRACTCDLADILSLIRQEIKETSGERAAMLPDKDGKIVSDGQNIQKPPMVHKIDAIHSWDDIVLPQDSLRQLKEICSHVKNKELVYYKWGFASKLASGLGLHILFSGPPGTGKTMASQIIAKELGMEIYKVDLALVVSKYIGETEKNLLKIFDAFQGHDAIILFDEADALFSKRSEVKDAHDRYANLETNFLLQQLDEYKGITILATNFVQNIDNAFLRRMHFRVEFPMPGEQERACIWRKVFPQQAPVSPSVDFGILAQKLDISGGNIRNIALNSAFYAAEDGGKITMNHIVSASRREYQKINRIFMEEDFDLQKINTNIVPEKEL